MGYRNIMLECCKDLGDAHAALLKLSRRPTEGKDDPGTFGMLPLGEMKTRVLAEIAKAKEALSDLEQIADSDM